MKADPLTRRRAKALRAELTEAERILWSRLKRDQMSGWRFRNQHPEGPYILDFACVPLKIAVEVDGATHSTDEERLHDEHRRKYLDREGWTMLRFWNADVYKNLDGVLRAISEVLPPRGYDRRSSPSVSPLCGDPPPPHAWGRQNPHRWR